MGRLRTILYLASLAAAFVLRPCSGYAQVADAALPEEKVIAFEDKLHDFGDVLLSDGPLKCSFKFTNISGSPILINNIISSCGCTTPEWTRTSVQPGGTGSIEVTFANDQGAVPFDKTLTVYVTSVNRPVILRIRGYAHDKRVKLAESYPFHIGQLAFRAPSYSAGYVDQGLSKSDSFTVANISRKPLTVSLASPVPGVSISLDRNPVPAQGTARMTVTFDSRTAHPQKWGKQNFDLVFDLDGRRAKGSFRLTFFVKDNFTGLSDAQIERAASPVPDQSYFEFGTVKAGKKVEASFRIRNTGSEPLVIHKVEADKAGIQFQGKCPVIIQPGAAAVLKFKYDTSKVSGETAVVLTLITNSPAKPLLNLFLTGQITK